MDFPDLSNIDPDLLAEVRQIRTAVWWGSGAITVAICFRLAGPSLADFVRALRGK